MSKLRIKRMALALLSGAILCQVPACAETALFVTSVSSVLTAGGVMYLVGRVLD